MGLERERVKEGKEGKKDRWVKAERGREKRWRG